MSKKFKVFIHTNSKQMVGAKVAEYTLKKNSKTPEAFDVEYIELDNYPQLKKREGKEYLRKGMKDTWKNDDLQSFTPLRFLPPQLMNYEGRAIVIDPDVFALGDIMELFNRDMQGKAIVCRKVPDKKYIQGYYFGTSVMLLDCEKLKHWKWDSYIDRMFDKKIDYRDWMSLFLEDENTIGELEEEWNSFDILNEKTKLLHNTGRLTQPWKTGLPVDFQNAEKFYKKKSLIANILGFGKKPDVKTLNKLPELYRNHPDPKQIDFFFSNLYECVNKGIVTNKELKHEVRSLNVRQDVFDILDSYAKKAA